MIFQNVVSQDWQTLIEFMSLAIQVLTLGLFFVQTMAVVIGIPLVLRQIHQQVDATRIQTESFQVSTYMQVMMEGSRRNGEAVADDDLAEFYEQDKLPADLSDNWAFLNNKYRKYYLYLGRIMSSLEEAFTLWNRGWMDVVDYRATLTQLREIMGMQIFELWWPRMKPYYREDFAVYVDSLRNRDDKTFFAYAIVKTKKSGN